MAFRPHDTLRSPSERRGLLLGLPSRHRRNALERHRLFYRHVHAHAGYRESGDGKRIKANLSHGYSTHHADVRFADSPAYAGTMFLMEAAKEYSGGRLVADASVHAEYTFGEGEIAAEIADFLRKSGLRMQVHVSETKQEHEACRGRRGMTPIQFFDKHGLFRVPTTAAHCVWLDEADFDILASRGVTVAHCPSSNMKLGSGVAPIAKMLERGVK